MSINVASKFFGDRSWHESKNPAEAFSGAKCEKETTKREFTFPSS